jgi:hypothetical protein
MSGLRLHRIEHVSASSLNLFAAEPALWVMERLCGRKGKVGPAAHVGTAVEAGVEAALLGKTEGIEAAAALAGARYDQLCDDQDAREKIAPMVRQAYAALSPYGAPDVPEDGRQHRVEIELEGVPVPCIGYTDFLFHAHGTVIDLKTSSTLPSAIKVAHARQGAVYARAFSNYAMLFAYATPKKSAVYILENPADHLAALANIGRRLDKFLSISADPQELAAIVCPDYDSFYWSDPQTRANGLALFGF